MHVYLACMKWVSRSVSNSGRCDTPRKLLMSESESVCRIIIINARVWICVSINMVCEVVDTVPNYRNIGFGLGFGIGICRIRYAVDEETLAFICARRSSSSIRHMPLKNASRSSVPLLVGSHSFLLHKDKETWTRWHPKVKT